MKYHSTILFYLFSTAYLPIFVPSISNGERVIVYLKILSDYVGKLDEKLLLKIVGLYYFNAGMFIATSIVYMQWKGFSDLISALLFIPLIFGVLYFISGIRLVKNIEIFRNNLELSDKDC
jgi:hypothetical protein